MRGTLGVLLCAALLLGGFGHSATAATMTVTGPPELIFDWSTVGCGADDIPDLPARAFRDGLGRTQLTIADYTNHRMVGPDLDHLTHDCQVTLASDRDAQPASYDDADWISATYALPSGE